MANLADFQACVGGNRPGFDIAWWVSIMRPLARTAEAEISSRPRALRGLAAIAFLTVLSCGCSFMFVDRAPRDHRQLSTFECTSSRALPTVDLTAFVLDAFVFGGATIESMREHGSDAAGILMIGALVHGLASALSATAGFVSVAACRDAKDELAFRKAWHPSGLRPVPPPWAPPPTAPGLDLVRDGER
jgi:hypothetical protein